MLLQVVEIRDLIDAIDSTRFGVNGGAGPMLSLVGWRKRLRDWLIENLSDTKQMRSMPLSGG